MAGLEGIHPIDPKSGVWPFDHLPPKIFYLGSTWDYAPKLAQFEGWVNSKLIGGYREDTPVPEQSRHMFVFQENGTAVFVVPHRETNPKYDLVGHAKEFAKEHPVVSVVVVGVAGAAIVGLLKAVADFLARPRR